jgi:dolichol kinase
MKLIIVISIFFILFGVVEILQRWTKTKHELTRKIAHIFSGIIIFFLPNFLTAYEIVSLAIVFSILLGISKYFGLLSSIHKVDRKTLGEVYFPLGIGISAFLFLPSHVLAFQFGVLILTFADSFAGIIGESFGKHKIAFLTNKKSLEGTFAFFITTFLIIFFFQYSQPSFFLLPALTTTILLTLIEILLSTGLDNLFLPILATYIFIIIGL